MIECPKCHDANKYGDYQGPSCDLCGGTGKVDAAEISQGELRDELTTHVLAWLKKNGGTPEHLINAAVACMGVTAICLGCLPPDARDQVSNEICASLLDHANKRSGEIRRGELDSRLHQ